MKFRDVEAKSVEGKHICLSRYLNYNKSERAKQFGIYPVWEITQSLVSISSGWLVIVSVARSSLRVGLVAGVAT